MRSTTRKLTEHTICTGHRLLKITGQQIKHLDHAESHELMQIFGKGRRQTHREELHGHRPFVSRMRSLQSRIQQKIKKNQRLRQRYANVQ